MARARAGSAVHGGQQRRVGADQGRVLPGQQRAVRAATLGDPLVREIHGLGAEHGRRPASRSARFALVVVVVVVAAVYAYLLNSRDPGLAGRVGSIVADE